MGIENMNIFVNQFNDEFGSKIEFESKETKLIRNIFNEYIVQTFKENKVYKEIMEKLLEIEDKLKNNLTEEQEKLFDKWETYKDELTNYISEQSFVYGFCCDKQFNLEKDLYKNKRNK